MKAWIFSTKRQKNFFMKNFPPNLNHVLILLNWNYLGYYLIKFPPLYACAFMLKVDRKGVQTIVNECSMQHPTQNATKLKRVLDVVLGMQIPLLKDRSKHWL